MIGSLVRVRLIRPRLASFSFRFFSGVNFFSRASAILVELRRMVMRMRVVMVFFIFFPLLGFWWFSLYIYL